MAVGRKRDALTSYLNKAIHAGLAESCNVIGLAVGSPECADIVDEDGAGGAVEANLRGGIHEDAVVGQFDAAEAGEVQLVA